MKSFCFILYLSCASGQILHEGTSSDFYYDIETVNWVNGIYYVTVAVEGKTQSKAVMIMK